jgi:membrane dipeptidase
MDPVEARAFHDTVPVIDLHADTPKLMLELDYDLLARHDQPMPRPISYLGHVDVPRMREGGVAAQIFATWTFPYPRRGCASSVHRQLDAMDAAVAASRGALVWARDADDIRAARARGQIACLAGIEGGHALEGDLSRLAGFADRGVRYLGLLHFSRNQLGAPAYGMGADRHRGLTDLGKACIGEMNRLGMLVDLAHINRKGFFEAVALSRGPVLVSHTGVLGVYETWRNIDDEQLRAVAETGGCVGVIFAPRFLGSATIDAVVDHLMHIIRVAGEDAPALGSDFDGFVVPTPALQDIAALPRLTAALARRGVSESVLRKILGENALRVLAS